MDGSPRGERIGAVELGLDIQEDEALLLQDFVDVAPRRQAGEVAADRVGRLPEDPYGNPERLGSRVYLGRLRVLQSEVPEEHRRRLPPVSKSLNDPVSAAISDGRTIFLLAIGISQSSSTECSM